MAKKTTTQLVDDLDGELLAPEQGETLQFSLDGVGYEIDLSAEHARQLRAALSLYIAASRRQHRAPSRPGVGAAGGTRSSEFVRIRDWAAENGHEMSPRGRLPERVKEAYYLALRARHRAGDPQLATTSV